MALKDKKIIIKLKLEMENISPLHIGADNGDILIDKEENAAYIPGTTLAGAFRGYLSHNGYKNISKLFGEGSNMSNIFLYDSFSNLRGMEIRPSVRIDKELGAAKDGGKFERNFITNEHKFILEIEIFATNDYEAEDYKKAIYSCIAGLNNGNITLGSFKSSGAGVFKINRIEENITNLKNIKELFSYLKQENEFKTISIDIINKNSFTINDITFSLDGIIETPLLIKGEDEMDADTVDGSQIKNQNGEYIIPGTSLRGVIRAQAERILSYHNKDEVSKYVFGSEDHKEKKIASRFKAFDSVIKDKKEGIYNRIKIDKFTGGVIKGALMNDAPVMGNVTLEGKLKYTEGTENEKIAVAVLGLVFRDIALGNLSLGSGYNIGRGRIKGKKLLITKGKETIYEYDFNSQELKVDNLNAYFEFLNKEAN